MTPLDAYMDAAHKLTAAKRVFACSRLALANAEARYWGSGRAQVGSDEKIETMLHADTALEREYVRVSSLELSRARSEHEVAENAYTAFRQASEGPR